MVIEFLKALHGDCIFIEESGKHILIDGGPSLCNTDLIEKINNIKSRKQSIDLLIVTHYDDDHINGIIQLIEEYANSIPIKEIWFNGIRESISSENTFTSANQQKYLAKLLSKGYVWKNQVQLGMEYKLSNETKIIVLYSSAKAEQDFDGNMTGTTGCDWGASIQELQNVENLDKTPDRSKSNADSIVTVLIHKEKAVLLPGDATPRTLELALDNMQTLESTKRYVCELGGKRYCRFEAIKLPHHGSYRNLSKKILERIICHNFYICTNGEIFNHPDLATFAKIHKWINVENGYMKFFYHCNYWNDGLREKMNIKDNIKKAFNFECDGFNQLVIE